MVEDPGLAVVKEAEEEEEEKGEVGEEKEGGGGGESKWHWAICKRELVGGWVSICCPKEGLDVVGVGVGVRMLAVMAKR